MKNIIFTVNELEKSGKTTLAQLIHGYYYNNDYESIIINTDYKAQDWLEECLFIDLDNFQDTTKLVDLLDENEGIIIDVYSGGLPIIQDYFEQNQLTDLLHDLDAKATIAIPTDGSNESNEQIIEVVETFSDTVSYIVSEFTKDKTQTKSKYKKSHAYKTIQYFNNTEIFLPTLPNFIGNYINTEDEILPILIENREKIKNKNLKEAVINWTNKSIDELTKIEKALNVDVESSYK